MIDGYAYLARLLHDTGSWEGLGQLLRHASRELPLEDTPVLREAAAALSSDDPRRVGATESGGIPSQSGGATEIGGAFSQSGGATESGGIASQSVGATEMGGTFSQSGGAAESDGVSSQSGGRLFLEELARHARGEAEALRDRGLVYTRRRSNLESLAAMLSKI